tara:strand:- start:117 stop:377 length:261 start_codon:yes stop_codon:yes gene_type:complete
MLPRIFVSWIKELNRFRMEETLETLKASDKGVDKKIKDNKESPTRRKRIVIAYDYIIVIIQNEPDAKNIYRKPWDAVAKTKANVLG